MTTQPPRLGLLRWLLRELSSDDEDMIAFVAGLPDADDDDAQALLEELSAQPTELASGPLRSQYQTGTQLLFPKDAIRVLDTSRATFYALVKRATFPAPVQIDDAWRGWPRDVLLDWADASARQRVAASPASGYSPFERSLQRPDGASAAGLPDTTDGR